MLVAKPVTVTTFQERVELSVVICVDTHTHTLVYSGIMYVRTVFVFCHPTHALMFSYVIFTVNICWYRSRVQYFREEKVQGLPVTSSIVCLYREGPWRPGCLLENHLLGNKSIHTSITYSQYSSYMLPASSVRRMIGGVFQCTAIKECSRTQSPSVSTANCSRHTVVFATENRGGLTGTDRPTCVNNDQIMNQPLMTSNWL